MEYLNRIADNILAKKLGIFGAVLIEGPKWCGKTTTAVRHAASILKLQDPDKRSGYLATAGAKPSLLLTGEKPRLIDEWQVAPVLWDSVRTAVDDIGEKGLFILTGSNSIPDKDNQIMHTGTGRISRMKMLPMSLWESGETKASISLKELFDNPTTDIDGASSCLTVEDLIFLACRGGWPAALGIKSDVDSLMIAEDYVNTIYETDISSVDGVRRNPTLARLILRSYARNLCTLATKKSLIADVKTEFDTLSPSTFDEYVNAFRKLFVIDDIEAWCPAIRSATSIRSGLKRCFIDPSIPVAAMGMRPEHFYTDLNTFGFVFENLCIRDLKAYSSAIGGHISYYHDRYDLETDAVLYLSDGRYSLIEFKLGGDEIEKGASHLIEMKRLIKEYNKTNHQVPLKEPDFLMVVTGGEIAYRRKDNVLVVPIGCLKD